MSSEQLVQQIAEALVHDISRPRAIVELAKGGDPEAIAKYLAHLIDLSGDT